MTLLSIPFFIFRIPELDIVPRDQHPDHPVEYGEELIKKVYESIRQSPYWNCSALVITYGSFPKIFDFKNYVLMCDVLGSVVVFLGILIDFFFFFFFFESDEHGGFADFSPMQTENVPPPDGHVSKNPSFNFGLFLLKNTGFFVIVLIQIDFANSSSSFFLNQTAWVFVFLLSLLPLGLTLKWFTHPTLLCGLSPIANFLTPLLLLLFEVSLIQIVCL